MQYYCDKLNIVLMKYKDFALERLKKNGLRITKARCCVLNILNLCKHGLNAYEITEKAKKCKVKIDTSTVYRILEAFQKLGLVHFVKEQNGYLACKELKCCEKKHCHHQFVCQKCHKVQEIHLDDSAFIKSVKNKIPALNIQNHYFEFFGKCSTCDKI